MSVASRAQDPTQTSSPERSNAFCGRTHRRYWWHWGQARRYVPDVYGCLTDEEWGVVEAWYDETERLKMAGEMAIPMISVLRGFLMGSGVSAVVQLGHYAGYSTLLLGFVLRRMGRTRALFSIDIHEPSTDFTRRWVEHAGLADQVALHLGDSADPASADAALAYLGRPPQVVIIDSSHQHAHTLRELDLWYERLPAGGMLFLHDASDYAATFDRSGEGGVRRALREWLARVPAGNAILIDGNADLSGKDGTAYVDGCGLGIIQKPPAPPKPIKPPDAGRS